MDLLVFLIAGLIMYNIYTDGRFLHNLLSYKKYYKMAGVFFLAVLFYWVFKTDPKRAEEFVQQSNEYLKYMPVDRNVTSILNPILDMTQRQSFSNNDINNDVLMNPVVSLPKPVSATKRNVSESRKKLVASSQDWKCGRCGKKLEYNFQVDHIVRLQYGGSNELDNLTALCPDCHSKKTILENLEHNSRRSSI